MFDGPGCHRFISVELGHRGKRLNSEEDYLIKFNLFVFFMFFFVMLFVSACFFRTMLVAGLCIERIEDRSRR